MDSVDTWESHSVYTSAALVDGRKYIFISDSAVETYERIPSWVRKVWMAQLVRVEVQYLVSLAREVDIVEEKDQHTSFLSEAEVGLFERINREREGVGLQPLVLDKDLTEVARERSQDMTDKKYFAHFYPGGLSAYELLSRAYIRFSIGGENLARVAGITPEYMDLVIRALMASPTHHANIFNSEVKKIGVSAVTDSNGITIFTMIFTD